MLAMLATSIAFLFAGSYARVETVVGQIEPDLGAAQIVPSRAGIVTAIPAKEGEHVRAASPLVSVRVEEIGRAGGTGPTQVLTALGEQDAQLAAQQRSTLAGAGATRQRLAAQITGLRAETAALDQQIVSQRRLVEVAQGDYDRSQVIASKGFLSRRDLQTREEALVGRQQQLASLAQTRADKQASLIEASRAIEEAGRTAQAAAAGIAGDRASVAQRRFDVEASRGYTLTSPIAGVVTAVTARIGQPAQPAAPLMTIVPAGARLEAQLYVPTEAAGFLTVGQEVRLQVDAFPYTRFGSVRAAVSRISSAAVNRASANGRSEPVYLVIASIDEPRIYAFGRFHRLQPDMTLTARIVTEKRTLAEWLFEPILAVRRR
ncbi:HlyD family efflux transporter periplasmic adaptor subunit [Sphingomonas sp. CD22]|uniref:HlyD family secretion protein n=1 Tax=Sphingomonas sp. CD22 TaxID=3100214 RepID=UPI002ADF7EC6|nr:HlyD family efflux transporter periplasmic adaptor subunit [Sphingomonas sp. CD22]MEA1083691.1 HlyD family efflux transporter periplasmic adaptor subunit [Sphingomonas sp. CD22]